MTTAQRVLCSFVSLFTALTTIFVSAPSPANASASCTLPVAKASSGGAVVHGVYKSFSVCVPTLSNAPSAVIAGTVGDDNRNDDVCAVGSFSAVFVDGSTAWRRTLKSCNGAPMRFSIDFDKRNALIKDVSMQACLVSRSSSTVIACTTQNSLFAKPLAPGGSRFRR